MVSSDQKLKNKIEDREYGDKKKALSEKRNNAFSTKKGEIYSAKKAEIYSAKEQECPRMENKFEAIGEKKKDFSPKEDRTISAE